MAGVVTFDVVTIFPRMVEAALAEGVVGRARQDGVFAVHVHDLRDYTSDRHRVVDDVPFGGGPGMVLKAEPFYLAVQAVRAGWGGGDGLVVITSPAGRRFDQAAARRMAGIGRVAWLCGRYEGIDERLGEAVGAEEWSIGDYVLSGGELPALVMLDAVARLIPGVVGDAQSVAEDSFSAGRLDHPHYTRPAVWRDVAVPDVLVSGHHGEIERWRRQAAEARTRARRPDLAVPPPDDEGNG
ncbi:MAG: tRNA (guanosine(37)-N1)-methyltransferase TrmD [Vicinamibacterales bacterium]